MITCPGAVTVSCIGGVPEVNISNVTVTVNCGDAVKVSCVGDSKLVKNLKQLLANVPETVRFEGSNSISGTIL